MIRMISFRHFVLEYMLTPDVVLKNLRKEQEKQLFLLSSEQATIKNSYPDIFSKLNKLPTHLLYAKKIMHDPDFKFKSAEQKKALSEFVQAPRFIDQQMIDNIESYINVKYK